MFIYPCTTYTSLHQALFSTMSTLQSQKHDHKIDLNVFKSDSIDCTSQSSKKHIVSNCSALQRIGSALKHIEHLQQSKDEFVEFCVDIYPHSIDDFAHILRCHGDEIKQIEAEFFAHFGLRMCSISDCTQFDRHRRRGKEEKENEKSDNLEFDFWLEQFDKMHHFIYHLFQTGKRIEFVSTKKALNDTEFDEEFAQKQKVLNDIQKDEQQKDKFLISVSDTAKSDKTALDEMYECIQNEETLQTLKVFIICNDFDSEALSDDVIGAENESNLMRDTNNEKLFQKVRDCLKLHQIKKKSFSTGLRMDYWDDNDSKYNEYVLPFFDDLKEEILESKFISIDVWEHIVMKAKNHFKSNKVKKIKYCRPYNCHGFNSDSLMNIKHLIAIILYCDYSKLCTFFSSTFRKMNSLETEQFVRHRNGKFYYFSRYLCEAVNDFGIDRDKEKGPFFCGINCVLNICSFAICFFGPNSTTKHIEVALCFANANGSVIKLQNDGDGQMQKFFDVSWISRYPDEAERLWINGNQYCALRIVTFRIISRGLDFKQFFHALYVFDAMLRNQKIDAKIAKFDYQIVNALINGNDPKIPPFIKDTFLLYRHEKKKIHICPYYLDKCFGEKMVDLIMHPLKNYGTEYDEEQNEWQVVNDFEVATKENNVYNVPRPALFEIFPNLKQVYLWTNGDPYGENGKYPEYKLLISSLLSFIDKGKSSVEYLILATRQIDQDEEVFFGQTWLDNVDFSSIDSKKYEVEKKREYNSRLNNQHAMDCLSIKKCV